MSRFTQYKPTKVNLSQYREAVDFLFFHVNAYAGCATDQERTNQAPRMREPLWTVETIECGRATERDLSRAEVAMKRAREIIGNHP